MDPRATTAPGGQSAAHNAENRPFPCVVVIFGASGDLTKRKLIPALFNLKTQGLLPDHFAVLGVARTDKNDDEFRAEMTEAMGKYAPEKPDPAAWKEFEGGLHYMRADPTDRPSFEAMKARLEEIDRDHGTGGSYMFYLAVPSDSFVPIVEALGAVGLTEEAAGGDEATQEHWRRVIVEKPFGRDLASARELDKRLSAILREDQTYRIDHYLGKETVQNLLVFRFGNGIFEPLWNRRYINHIQITVAESIGIEGRGNFYESAGALRDMVQSHMFQLLALVAMEPPTSITGESVRNEKTKVLESIRPFTAEEVFQNVVRGQYSAGTAAGKPVPDYRKENGVAPDSNMETYAAMRLQIENWRWAGVPFYLRTGKGLAQRNTFIEVEFKEAPLMLYGGTPMDRIGRNRLLIHVQPCEGIMMQIRVKTPGPTLRTQAVPLDFNYEDLGNTPATGYETLLHDCMTGDATLFHRIDMVEASWQVITPILEAWAADPPTKFPNYEAGTWGPESANELLAERGNRWWTPGG